MNLSDDSLRRLREVVDFPDLSDTRYRLIGRLGSGGMGSVYLVEDVTLRRKAALKVLSVPDPTGDLTRRLTREAQIIANLEHPGIVPVHDVGTLPDGRVFYTMKYVQGKDLFEHAKTVTSLADRLRLIQRVCEATAFAHSRGVIHRDLKPANILIGEFGEVLVMDWGVAKVFSDSEAENATLPADAEPGKKSDGSSNSSDNRTADGTVIGTPAYMSPEQFESRMDEVDHRSDIYSIGAIMFSLLTGQYPRHPGEPIVRPREITREVPRPVESICLKAMQTDRRERYESAIALSDDISRFLDKEPVTAHREGIIERVGRLIQRHQFIFLLIAAYIAVRIILYFLRDI